MLAAAVSFATCNIQMADLSQQGMKMQFYYYNSGGVATCLAYFALKFVIKTSKQGTRSIFKNPETG